MPCPEHIRPLDPMHAEDADCVVVGWLETPLLLPLDGACVE